MALRKFVIAEERPRERLEGRNDAEVRHASLVFVREPLPVRPAGGAR